MRSLPGSQYPSERPRRRRGPSRSVAEAEQHHVAVPNHKLPAFGAGQALLAREFPATDADEVVIGDRLRANEAFLEIRVDDPRGRGGLVAAMDGPRSDLLL